jgi:membrane protease subunit HflK
MPWKEPGKGGKDPWKQGDQPPELDEVFQNVQNKVRNLFGGGGSGGQQGSSGGGGGGAITIVLVLVALWAVWDSIHIIDEAERGVVLRFGEYTRTMEPGFNLALPRPVDSVIKVNVSNVRSAEDRGQMLTEDENLVEFDYKVQYVITDPQQFLFQVRDPELTLLQAAESALRESVGTNRLDAILEGTTREQVRIETQRVLQETLDNYEAGIRVTEFNLAEVSVPAQVREAYSDVIRAREDAQRFIEEARVHANSVIPDARGRAARILEEAQGYRDSTIALAEGEADRFRLQVEEYRRAPEVTRKRMYLQAMEGVLADAKKVLLDVDSSGNVLYLPLEGATGGAAGSTPIPPLMTPDDQRPPQQSDRAGRTPRTVNRETRQ